MFYLLTSTFHITFSYRNARGELKKKPLLQVRGTVYISRQLILKQVMNDLKLKVHGSGFDSTLETLNMETAWLHVDLPCGNKGGADSATVIFGNPKPSRNEAAESACQAVLDYYCSARDVKIDDFSSTVLKKKQEELDASKFFCAAMQDKVVRLVLERNAAVDAVQKLAQNIDVKLQPLSETIIKQKQDQLNNDCYYEILQDKITTLLRDRSVQKVRYSSMIHDINSVCDKFGDVLPLKKVKAEQTLSEHTQTGFSFTGNQNNPSRVDELALSLLKILGDGMLNEIKHDTTPLCMLLNLSKSISLYAYMICAHLPNPLSHYLSLQEEADRRPLYIPHRSYYLRPNTFDCLSSYGC